MLEQQVAPLGGGKLLPPLGQNIQRRALRQLDGPQRLDPRGDLAIAAPKEGDLLAPTSTQRYLEGQSPYVLNAYLGYDNERSGTNARVLFNTFGRRIAFVGGNHLPDVYELPIHTMDVTFAQRIYKGLSMSFSAFNLLNWRQRFVQGDNNDIFYSTRRGIFFLVGLSYAI